MNKILFVDDDPNLLSGIRRQFRRRYEIDCAEGGREGLDKLANGSDYAVVISDMRMPEMDGVEFLATVARKYPDPTRIMLTGNADQNTAVDAVNRGHVFSFLNKPCAPEDLSRAIDTGLEQYRLKTLEKDLLERTLAGSVKVLLDVMRVASPLAFGRSCALRDLALEIARSMGVQNLWEIRIATLLSSIGWVSVPEHVLEKVTRNLPLTDEERSLVARQPEVAYELLKQVPRFEEIARIIRYQNVDFEDAGTVLGEEMAEEELPLGSRILHVLNAMVPINQTRPPSIAALDTLVDDGTKFDPAVLLVTRDVLESDAFAPTGDQTTLIEVSPSRFLPGDVLEEDLVTVDGALLLSAGNELSVFHITKLRHHPKYGDIVDTVLVKRAYA